MAVAPPSSLFGTALLVGTDLASVCTNPDTRLIRELLRCRDDVLTRD
jgi:hypothetical protein